jgi:1,5-anhydro-D-fructose reductase (1,5-anhydro-D-mannitol-forming)
MTVLSAWTPRPTIRWGIIGCGDVTEVKSGPGFQKSAGSQLVAVMRRNTALAQDYARRHGVPKWTTDADALIRDPDVDAVYIATPPGSHLEYALRVCDAGKPAYVEKPMARNATECARMVEAFARARLPLFVAYYRRAQPRFLKVKALLDGGAIGRVTSVRYHLSEPRHIAFASGAELPWRLDPATAGGGLVLDVGSHSLDLLDFFFGPFEQISGHAANLASPYEVEDTLSLIFRTPAGAPGTASWNFAGAAKEDLFQLTGTQGRLCFSTFGSEPLRLETADGRVEEFPFTPPEHVGQPLIQAVVDDLRGLGHCPSTGESAARTSRVLDLALSSYYSGRADDFWLRRDSWPGRRKI